MKLYTLTETQLTALERGLVLAEYFVQEHQTCDHAGDMAEQCAKDEETYNEARQVIYTLRAN